MTLSYSIGLKDQWKIFCLKFWGQYTSREISFGNGKIHRESVVNGYLAPEFRNRIDTIVRFEPLERETMEKVVRKFIEDLALQLRERSVEIEMTDRAVGNLVEWGVDPAMGARSVKRALERAVKLKIANEMLYGTLRYGGTARIDWEGEEFVYRFEEKEPKDDARGVAEELHGVWDFETVQEAQEYARTHPGAVITRSPSGYGYIILKAEP
ncbi:hypothetical protein [Nitratifractor sp.]